MESQFAALIMYHFKIDVDKVSEDEFAKYVGWLIYALKHDSKWKE